ncbi:hypothetical protein PI125_g26802 [Phytophthora idaei]|nr:hypothetical protein PI125_g26802 [Phytophthora idaei]KAG3121219.1 hypothetical protein PI126_g24457 [Phytophthora idaei]
MAPDVVLSDGFGPYELAKSWSVLRWFDDVVMDLQSLSKQGEDSVVMTTRTSTTITERTLQSLFPHLYERESNDGRSAVKAMIVDKLLDHQVDVYSRTLFQWNRFENSMASVNTDSDLLTPILRLLGRFEDVSLVFEQALVSPVFQWRPTS